MLSAIVLFALSPIVDEGRDRLTDGDARGAMIRAEQAIRADPSDAQARVLLAEALLVLGEADRAEKMAGAALRDGAGDAARLVQAEALYTLGRFAEAETIAAEASEAVGDPRRAAVLGLARAELSLLDERPEAALSALGTVVTVPSFARRAELVAARAQYARGDLVRAQRLLDNLIAADDLSFPALLLRARVALRSGDAARARQLADAMLTRDPGNVSAGAVAIEAALRLGDRTGARAVLATLEPLGDDPRPAYLGALILLEEGKVREAGDVIAPIEGWLSTVDGGAVLIARVRAETGRTSQAEKVLRDRLRRDPADVAAAATLINVLDNAGKRARGDEVLEQALRAAADAPALVSLAAERMIAAGKPDAGLALLAEQDPARAQLLKALFGGDAAAAPRSALTESYLALRSGDTQRAMAAAQRALSAERSPAALNLLAAAQARSGDSSAARESLNEAIERAPDFLAPIANLAALDGGPDALLIGLERAFESGARSPSILSRLATERFVTGRTDEALDAARAAAIDGDPAAALLLARLRLAAGVEAAPGLAALMAAHPTDPAVIMPAAGLLEGAGRAASAAPALLRLARHTREAGHYLAAAAAADAAGDKRGAALAARSALKQNPGAAPAVLAVVIYDTKLLGVEAGLAVANDAPADRVRLRAAAFETAGQAAKARDLLLSNTASLSSAGHLDLLRLATGTDDEAAAIDALRAWADRHPDDVGVLVALGATYGAANRTTLAEDALRRGLAARPNDPVLSNNLAALRADSDLAGALTLSRAAYAQAPQRAAIAQTYAELLAKTGQADDAARILRRARLGAPTDPDLSATLAGL